MLEPDDFGGRINPQRRRNKLFRAMTSKPKLALPLLYLILLAWVNIYICQDMFFTEYTGHMNSMHGVWIAMARLAPTAHWTTPIWWPHWYGGMPFEFTYAPLLPDLTAAYAKIIGCSPARAYHSISGLFYCLTPLALFLMAWQITLSPGYSFAAGLAYSLVSPTELLVPDSAFKLTNVWSARRLYLTAVWDETPHVASLMFATLVLLFLSLSFRYRRPSFYILAGISMAAAILSNAFGGPSILIILFCLAFALETKKITSNILLALAIGTIAYVVISPWFPPSLMGTIRFNADRFEGGWTIASLTAFLGLVLGWMLLWRYLHRWTGDWPMRFFALLTFATSSIPLLAAYANRHFLPQPGRYKVEMEMALVLLIVFAARSLLKRVDIKTKVVLAVFLLSLAGEQVVGHRRFAKNIIRSIDITQTIEYRVAKRVEEQFPKQRVMMPGSIGQWLNAFTEAYNFGGGSFPTAPNWTQQIASYDVYAGQTGADSITWLKAFGTQAVAVSGPNSQEFWKPYANPRKFEGLLPIVWREDDVTLYRLPQRSPSLAHVVPAGAVVRLQPHRNPSLREAEKYVAALDDPSLPLAQVQWKGSNEALISTNAQKGQLVSVQVNYHRGWSARSNGKRAEVFEDGLGLLCIRPDCGGPCEVTLRYDGGWEYRLCRYSSALVLAVVLGYAFIARRRSTLLTTGPTANSLWEPPRKSP